MPRWSGAVLTGGTSARMGTDKATLVVEGVSLGATAVGALRGVRLDPADGASVHPVVVVGDPVAHAGFGVDVVADGRTGPLGGVLAALDAAAASADPPDAVVVLACDLPHVTAAAVTDVLRAASSAGPDRLVLVTVDGRAAPPCGVWPLAVRHAVRVAHERGERGFRWVGPALGPVPVEGGDAFRDADRPGDLPGNR